MMDYPRGERASRPVNSPPYNNVLDTGLEVNRRNFVAGMGGLATAVLGFGFLCSGEREARETAYIPRDKETGKFLNCRLEGTNVSGEKVNFSIPAKEYEAIQSKNIARSLDYVNNRAEFFRAFVASSNGIISPIAEALTQGPGTNEEKTQHLLNWVKSTVNYDRKEVNSGRNYMRTPLETLYEKAGDSEDISLLCAALCKSIGIECVLLEYGANVLLGIPGEFSGFSISTDSVKYYLADTTDHRGSKLGKKGIGEVAQLYQRKTPVVIHLFTDRELMVTNESGTPAIVDIPIESYLNYCERRISRSARAENDWETVKEFITADDPVIEALADALTSGCGTQEEKCTHLLNWVRENHQYVYDVEDGPGRVPDFYRFPVQTLFEGMGDCEDTSFLFASLALASQHIDLDVGLARYPRHICPITTGSFTGEHFSLEKKAFYIAETAGEGPTYVGSPSNSRGSAYTINFSKPERKQAIL